VSQLVKRLRSIVTKRRLKREKTMTLSLCKFVGASTIGRTARPRLGRWLAPGVEFVDLTTD